MAVDVEEGGEAIVVDYVGGPDFVVEGGGGDCGGGGANGVYLMFFGVEKAQLFWLDDTSSSDDAYCQSL